MIPVEAGGCAPPVQVPTIADRIQEYLLGKGAHNPVQLLREVREEVLQLDCAARLAIEAARKARQKPPAFVVADLVAQDVPANVLEAADTVEQFFKRKGIDHWKLLGLQSREAP